MRALAPFLAAVLAGAFTAVVVNVILVAVAE
jgi:hypothetical protein